MTLGELIQHLSLYRKKIPLWIEGPLRLFPNGVGSYRGYREDLAIGFDESEYQHPAPMTCGQFATILRDAIGATFTGCKGGEYTMHSLTRVWVARYRECPGCQVDSVYEDNGAVYIGVRMRWRQL